MRYLQLIFIFMLITVAFSVDADLVRNQACKKYTDESGNETAEYDEDRIKSAKEDIESTVDGDNALRKYLITDEIEQSELINEVIGVAIPWAVFFVISIFCLISYCYCCCCTKCACCCNKKTPLTKIDMMWPLIGACVFCVYVLFSSSFGAGNSSSFLEDFYMMKCSILNFLADFNVGNTSNPEQIFIGLTALSGNILQIKNEFVVNIAGTFEEDNNGVSNDNAWIVNDYISMGTEKEKQDDYPSHQTYDYVPPTQDGVTADASYFFGTTWPIYVTTFNSIYDGAITSMKNSMADTNQQGLDMGGPGFTKSLDDGNKSILDFKKTIDDSVTNVDDNTGSIEDVIPTINLVFTLYFTVTILFSIIGLGSSAFFIFKKANPLRICLNFTWFIFTFWAIIGFLLATIFSVISDLGYQGCDIMNKALGDYDEFEGLGVIGGSSAGYIKRCKKEYGGDGFILQEFGLDTTLQQMIDLNNSMQATIDESKNQEDDLNKIRQEIQNARENLELLASSGYTLEYSDPTVVPFVPGSAREEYALKHAIVGDPSTSTVSNFNCGGVGNIQFYEGPVDGADTCKQYSVFLGSPSTANANPCLNIQSYQGTGSGCTGTNTDLDNTLLYIKQKNGYYTTQEADFAPFDTAVINYLDDTDTYIGRLEAFVLQNDSILTGAQNMMTRDVNCLFLGTNIDGINNSMCVGLFPAINRMTTILKANSFGLLFASFFLVFAQHRIPKFGKEQNGITAVGDAKETPAMQEL